MIASKGIAWADVSDGQELPPLTFPVTYRTLALDVAGTRDIYPIHHDPVFARANGVRDIFLNTMWYQGLIGRFITDWGGPESFLRKLSISMRAHGCPGDVLTVYGTVSRVHRAEGGLGLVDVDIRIDNNGYTGAVVASVTVELP